MGLEMSMWQMEMSKLEQLIISDKACEEFLETQFPDPDAEEDEVGRGRTAKYSVDPEDQGISMGKTWHLLHYLITGTEERGELPLALAIMIGHPVEGLGGEFCWLTPEEVKDVALALDTLSKEELRKRSNRDSMSKVDIYRCPPGLDEEGFRDVMKDFKTLKKYYSPSQEKQRLIK